MFESRDVAAYIAQECDKRGIEYNNTKIQKLMYCCYGVSLAYANERICDEYPRVWPHGPVFPKVFKCYQKMNGVAGYSTVFRDTATEKQKNIVEAVLDCYGKYNAGSLSAWSHQEGSPWWKLVKLEDAPWNSFMPDEYIQNFFKGEIVNGQVAS